MNFEFLKITAPIVFNQRFEPGNLGSESKCSSLCQVGTCMLKVGTMWSMIKAGQMK